MISRSRLALLVTLCVCLLLGILPANAQTATPDPDEFTSRTYELFLPEREAGDDSLMPLLIVLHGAGGSGARTQGWVGIDELAQEAGFAVVYPDGRFNNWDFGGGIRVPNGFQRSDDVNYLLWLADTLAAEHPIDPQRLYIAGMSNGASMAYRMACEAPNRVSAVAGVAAPLVTLAALNCDRTPVSVLFIHGTDDQILPWERTYAQNGQLASFSSIDSFTFWTVRNQCNMERAQEIELPDVDTTDSSTVRHVFVTGCAEGTEVHFYAVIGGGHTWPGHPFEVDFDIGPTNNDIDASKVIIDWFAELAARAA